MAEESTAEILDRCLDEVLAGRSTIDACLARYPDLRATRFARARTTLAADRGCDRLSCHLALHRAHHRADRPRRESHRICGQNHHRHPWREPARRPHLRCHPPSPVSGFARPRPMRWFCGEYRPLISDL